MKYVIEIEKYANKDYTLNIYEGNNIFLPVFCIKSPKHRNKIGLAIAQFLIAKKFVNIFQAKNLTKNFKEDDTL